LSSQVSIHNGGGCGWGEVINGGFGMLLDGSEDAKRKATSMLHWDVVNGVSRRCWAGNENAHMTILEEMEMEKDLIVTLLPSVAEEELLRKVCALEVSCGGEKKVEQCAVVTSTSSTSCSKRGRE
jgi:urocanate hydratase